MRTRSKIMLIIGIAFVGLLILGFIGSQLEPSDVGNSEQTSLPDEQGQTETQESSKKITISYTLSKKDSFVWQGESGASYVQQADADKVFFQVDMTINNIGYEEFSTNSFYFSAMADNIKYNVALETSYLDNWESVDILDGGTFEGTLIFEVSDSVSSISLGYERPFTNYNIVWNET